MSSDILNYEKHSVSFLSNLFLNLPKKVVLTGETLSIPEIIAVARNYASVELTESKITLNRVKKSYDQMINQVKKGVPIYGCNTGYGARASRVLTNGTAKRRLEIAKNISNGIIHVDVSVGPEFSPDITRAAMLIRVNMLLKGVSAIRKADLETYLSFLNKGLTPVVNQFGGIGASGDLAHNARVLSAVRQLESSWVLTKKGNKINAAIIKNKYNIPPLKLEPKAGLGFVNGDNFSTALATILAFDLFGYFQISLILSAMITEALKGTDRSYHPLLADVRTHSGQKEVSEIMRALIFESRYAYQEMRGHKRRPPGIKVQDGYSLRCLSQYYGVSLEKIKRAYNTIRINANSSSDNPLWVSENSVTENETPWQWVSGGNFLAMHMAETMDDLRKCMTHIVKMNDRHLSRLVNPNESNGLPPNLSHQDAVTQCALKGIQIQSGMFEVYSSLLSIPVTTFFGVHEEGNQDVTSHALTSGIFGLENIKLVKYSLSQNIIATMQAIRLRGGEKKLSPKTKLFFDYFSECIPTIREEIALHSLIEKVFLELDKIPLKKIINNIYNDIA